MKNENIPFFEKQILRILLVATLGIAFFSANLGLSQPAFAKQFLIPDTLDLSLLPPEAGERIKHKDAALESLSLPDNSASLEEIALSSTPSVPVTYSRTTYSFPTYTPAYSSNLFSIINPTPVSSPSVDAGRGVMLYNGKFLYAHSTLAFSPLKSLSYGSELYIELNGSGGTYRVDNVLSTHRSRLDSNSGLRSAIYNAQYMGKSYAYALMTCGDGSNDDDNYRYILFVNRVD